MKSDTTHKRQGLNSSGLDQMIDEMHEGKGLYQCNNFLSIIMGCTYTPAPTPKEKGHYLCTQGVCCTSSLVLLHTPVRFQFSCSANPCGCSPLLALLQPLPDKYFQSPLGFLTSHLYCILYLSDFIRKKWSECGRRTCSISLNFLFASKIRGRERKGLLEGFQSLKQKMFTSQESYNWYLLFVSMS